jgi:hypothetical protein
MAAHDHSSAQAQCDVARAAETLGDAWAEPKTARPAKEACEVWRESASVRESVKVGENACGGPAGRERIAAKLKACR